MSRVDDLLAKLKNGDIPSSSKLDLINEKRQEIPKGVNITRFSYEYQKNARVPFRLQMALPFDPELGEPTEKFNPENKWRPPLSPTSAAKVVKAYAKANEKTRQLLMSRASVSDWDVSDPETLTEQDFKVLRGYRVPLVITAEAITINDAVITGQDFAISYSVPIKRDLQTGQIIGEIPAIAKIGSFMSAVTYAEINELDDAIKAKDPSKYKNQRPFINVSSIPGVDDKTKKEWVSKILNTAIISSVKPQNYLMAFEFKLSSTKQMVNEERNPLPVFTNLTEDDLKEKQVFFNYSKKYKEPIMKVLSTPALDVFWDFVEMDICDSAAAEPKDKQAKADASRALSPAAPSHSFWNIDENKIRAPWVAEVLAKISDFIDSDPAFEEKMAMFVARQLRPMDDRVVGTVADRLTEKLPLTNRYVTDSILKSHKDACLLIYQGDYTDALIERGLLAPSAETDTPKEEEKKADSVADLINEIEEEDSEEANDLPDPTMGMEETQVDSTEIKI